MLVAILLLMLPAPAEAGKKVRLAYQPHEGAVVDWEVGTEGSGTIHMKAMGIEQDVPITYDIRMQYTLTDLAPEGDRVVQQGRLRGMEITMPDPSGPQSHTRIDADHVISDGQDLGPPPFAAAFREPFATLRFGPTAETIHAESRQVIPTGNETFDEIITLILPVLPEGKVKVGATWAGSRVMPMSVQLEEELADEVSYTLRSIDGNIATIGLQGSYSGRPGDIATASNGMKLEIAELRYDVSGEAHFDVREGVLLDSKVDLNIRFAGKTPDGQLEMRVDIPSTYSTVSAR